MKKKILVIAFVYAILLLLPDIVNVVAPSVKGYLLTIVYAFIHYLCLACAFSILIEWVFSKMVLIGNIIHVLVHVFVCIYSFGALLLYYDFRLQWNEITFQLLRETTYKECYGFVVSYCMTLNFLLAVLFLGLFFCTEWFVIKREPFIFSFKSGNKWVKITQVIVSCALLGWTLFLSRFYINTNDVDSADRFFVRTGVWNTERSYLQFRENIEAFDKCALNQININIDDVSYNSSNIILIVGESYIKSHSQLYGYSMETNPLLSKESNLYLFNDVISSFNATSVSFENFLSLASVDDTLKWYEAPLFPAMFKQSGYNVVFYSNQYFLEGHQGSAEASAGFMNLPSIAPHMFTHRNNNREIYDGQLIDRYISERDAIEANENNLIIYHLFGQHYPAEIQYPGSFYKFHGSDENRSELDEQEREEVARYDNATLYNDYVIHKIIDLWRERDAIIIYFSDHGDEIHDFRHKIGRSFDFRSVGAPVVHCQLDIPFMIYMSDEYKETHPDIVHQIEMSLNKPFMTDDLPHMLIELAGIKTPWYNSARSLINDNFDVTRRRKIDGGDLYYEDFCVRE